MLNEGMGYRTCKMPPLTRLPSYLTYLLFERTGAVSDFTARVWQTTSMSKVSAFHNISETSGDSMATKIATSEGSSRSNATWFTGKNKGSGNATAGGATEASEEEKSLQRANSQTTSSATVIECKCCSVPVTHTPIVQLIFHGKVLVAFSTRFYSNVHDEVKQYNEGDE